MQERWDLNRIPFNGCKLNLLDPSLSMKLLHGDKLQTLSLFVITGAINSTPHLEIILNIYPFDILFIKKITLRLRESGKLKQNQVRHDTALREMGCLTLVQGTD